MEAKRKQGGGKKKKTNKKKSDGDEDSAGKEHCHHPCMAHTIPLCVCLCFSSVSSPLLPDWLLFPLSPITEAALGGGGGAVFIARIVILGSPNDAWSEDVRGGLIREGKAFH